MTPVKCSMTATHQAATIIAEIRARHPRITVRDLCKATGYGRRMMQRYISGEREAREATLVALRMIRDSDTVRSAYGMVAQE